MNVSTEVIDLNDEDFWSAQVSQVDQLLIDVNELLGKTGLLQERTDSIRTLNLTHALLSSVRLAWDMTESAPGDVAALTVEPVEDEERIQLRLRLSDAIVTAQHVVTTTRQLIDAQ